MPRYKTGRIKNGAFAGLKYRDFNFVVEYCKDFNPRRAAVASGFEPDTGYDKKREPLVMEAIEQILARRLEASDIDAEWFLMELVDNHYLAREMGQITASNAALNMVGKHRDVDAYAADKVKIDTADDVVQRLQRARHRIELDDEPSFL